MREHVRVRVAAGLAAAAQDVGGIGRREAVGLGARGLVDRDVDADRRHLHLDGHHVVGQRRRRWLLRGGRGRLDARRDAGRCRQARRGRGGRLDGCAGPRDRRQAGGRLVAQADGAGDNERHPRHPQDDRERPGGKTLHVAESSRHTDRIAGACPGACDRGAPCLTRRPRDRLRRHPVADRDRPRRRSARRWRRRRAAGARPTAGSRRGRDGTRAARRAADDRRAGPPRRREPRHRVARARGRRADPIGGSPTRRSARERGRRPPAGAPRRHGRAQGHVGDGALPERSRPGGDPRGCAGRDRSAARRPRAPGRADERRAAPGRARRQGRGDARDHRALRPARRGRDGRRRHRSRHVRRGRRGARRRSVARRDHRGRRSRRPRSRPRWRPPPTSSFPASRMPPRCWRGSRRSWPRPFSAAGLPRGTRATSGWSPPSTAR